jgi:hypothetical protein
MDDLTPLISALPKVFGDDPADFEEQYAESIDSPNDMLVDSDDLIVDSDLNEKDDVININPDSDGEPPLRADDCMYIFQPASYMVFSKVLRADLQDRCCDARPGSATPPGAARDHFRRSQHMAYRAVEGL